MEILTPDRYEEYEQFVKNHKNGGFTQSVNWAKVKNNWEHAVIVSRDKTSRIKGGALVLILLQPQFGTAMLYSPRGPVYNYDDQETLCDLFVGIKQLACQYNAYIYKADPYILEDATAQIAQYTSLGFSFIPGQSHAQTIQTRQNYMIKNLRGKTMDQVLSEVGRRVRYDMNYSARQGVECRRCGIEALDDFYGIYERTGKRDKFSIRPKEYLERFLKAFPEDARLYVCYYEGQPLCGGISVQYAGKTCHVYGASSEEHREVRPTYLMQKTMIEWAVEGGCDIYDFQGVVTDPEENPYLYGVYEFKKQFKNGELVTYAGEFDYIFNPQKMEEVNRAK